MYNYSQIEQKVADKLIKLGFRTSNKGFNCIILGVIEVYKNDSRGICQIYKCISDKLGMSHIRVERNIRSEITSYYNDVSDVPSLLEPNYYSGKLTNNEFLHRLAYMFRDILGDNTNKS